MRWIATHLALVAAALLCGCATSGGANAAVTSPDGGTPLMQAAFDGDIAEAQRLRALFLPLEDLRDAHSPLRVLHEAVSLAGISETGPLLPYLANITDAAQIAAIGREAIRLLDANKETKAEAA